MDTLFLNEQRCKCGKLLLKGIFFDGILEIKCKKCGLINKIGSIKLPDDGTHYFFITNNKGEIVNASNFASVILGYTYEELVSKHIKEIDATFPKEVMKGFFGQDSILGEDNYFQLDTIHNSKEGKNIPVTVLFKLHKQTKKEKQVLISVELKNNVNTKKVFNKDVLEFFDNASDFYFDIDKTGIVEYMSPSVEKFFVFRQEAIIGKNYFECVPIGNRGNSKKIFEYFSVNGKPYRTEDTACLSTNGKAIHTELCFTPNYNDMGKYIGYHILGWVTE